MATDAPLWERAKENAAPLQRGRNVAVLEQSLAQTDQDRLEKARMVEQYERLVRPLEHEHGNKEQQAAGKEEGDLHSDDPLIHWLSYIKFHQDSFPSDTHQEFLLLERCVRSMCNIQKYADDLRFVRVCATYASKTEQANEVFQHLHRQKIGGHTAMFWAAWAFVVEKNQDFTFAEKIYKKGIIKNAQPIDYLRQRHQQFQRRLSRHWLNAGQDGQEDDDDETMDRRGRAGLGALSEEAFRKNDRSRTASSSRASRMRPAAPSNLATFVDRSASRRAPETSNLRNTSATGFAIFVEDSAENSGYPLNDSLVESGDVQCIERQQDRRKENTLAAERWNERGGLDAPSYSRAQAPPARAPTPPSFAVFVDEECAAKNERDVLDRQSNADSQRRHLDERTFREREDGGAAERLTKDPLRYVRDPSQLATDQQEEQESRRLESREPSRSANPKSKKSGSGISCAFNRKLLKDSTGHEQCFEEARALAGNFKLAPSTSNMNMLYRPSSYRMNDSAMSMEESGSIDVSMEDTSRLLARPPTQERPTKMVKSNRMPLSVKSPFRSDSSVDAVPTPRNASTASSTVDELLAVGVAGGREEQTINTQFALRELSMMFSSPAFGMNESVLQVDRSGGLGPILNQSGVSEAADGGDGDTATFESIEELIGGGDSNHSFRREALESAESLPTSRENRGLGNPNARSSSAPDFDSLALRTLEEEQGHDQPGCSSTRRRGVGRLAQVDPLESLQEVHVPAEPGFAIYEEEEDEQEQAGFAIYQDTGVIEGDGDTATLSLFGDAMDALTDVANGGIADSPDTATLLASPPPVASEPSVEVDFGDISRIAEVEDVDRDARRKRYNGQSK